MVIAVMALVFNALVLGAESAVDSGPPIPLFHWAFTAVTAVLAGRSTARAARDRHGAGVVAAVASGVVTLPLFTLGWALHSSRLPDSDAVVATLFLSGSLGVVPLVVAVAVVAGTDARG